MITAAGDRLRQARDTAGFLVLFASFSQFLRWAVLNVAPVDAIEMQSSDKRSTECPRRSSNCPQRTVQKFLYVFKRAPDEPVRRASAG